MLVWCWVLGCRGALQLLAAHVATRARLEECGVSKQGSGLCCLTLYCELRFVHVVKAVLLRGACGVLGSGKQMAKGSDAVKTRPVRDWPALLWRGRWHAAPTCRH